MMMTMTTAGRAAGGGHRGCWSRWGGKLNGHGGIVHGGVLSLLFDEVMGSTRSSPDSSWGSIYAKLNTLLYFSRLHSPPRLRHRRSSPSSSSWSRSWSWSWSLSSSSSSLSSPSSPSSSLSSLSSLSSSSSLSSLSSSSSLAWRFLATMLAAEAAAASQTTSLRARRRN